MQIKKTPKTPKPVARKIQNLDDSLEIADHVLQSTEGWEFFTPDTTGDDARRIFENKYKVKPLYVFYSKFGNAVVAGPVPNKNVGADRLANSVKLLGEVADAQKIPGNSS